jgi:hypothetical protein
MRKLMLAGVMALGACAGQPLYTQYNPAVGAAAVHTAGCPGDVPAADCVTTPVGGIAPGPGSRVGP